MDAKRAISSRQEQLPPLRQGDFDAVQRAYEQLAGAVDPAALAPLASELIAVQKLADSIPSLSAFYDSRAFADLLSPSVAGALQTLDVKVSQQLADMMLTLKSPTIQTLSSVGTKLADMVAGIDTSNLLAGIANERLTTYLDGLVGAWRSDGLLANLSAVYSTFGSASMMRDFLTSLGSEWPEVRNAVSDVDTSSLSGGDNQPVEQLTSAQKLVLMALAATLLVMTGQLSMRDAVAVMSLLVGIFQLLKIDDNRRS